MKKKKNSIATIALVVIMIGLFFILSQNGLMTSRSGTRIGYVESLGTDHWSASYTMISGTYSKKMKANDDMAKITVVTESGQIHIELVNGSGEQIFARSFDGNDTVDVKVPNKYTVKIKADKHEGSFEIE